MRALNKEDDAGRLKAFLYAKNSGDMFNAAILARIGQINHKTARALLNEMKRKKLVTFATDDHVCFNHARWHC